MLDFHTRYDGYTANIFRAMNWRDESKRHTGSYYQYRQRYEYARKQMRLYAKQAMTFKGGLVQKSVYELVEYGFNI